MSKLINPKLLESEKEIQELKKQVQDLNNKINSFKYSILWENPEPRSARSDFTITTENMSEYDLLLICWHERANVNERTGTTLILKVIDRWYTMSFADKEPQISSRNFHIDSNTAITFECGEHWVNGSKGSYSLGMIPIYIIGIKSGLSLTD